MNTSMDMEKGWFKIPRSFSEWPWYGNSACVHTYIHLMLKANYKPKAWEDTVIERGELITSLKKLSEELNLSVNQLRSILKKLEKTNFIERKGTSHYTLIKVVNYGLLQGSQNNESQTDHKQTTNKVQADNKQTTNKVQADNKQTTTTKEIKKEKKDKNEMYYTNTSRKNFFCDYDDNISEFEIELMRRRVLNN